MEVPSPDNVFRVKLPRLPDHQVRSVAFPHRGYPLMALVPVDGARS